VKITVNLKKRKNPLIEKFKDKELLPIITNNSYHSHEFLEDNNEQNTIIVYNLQ
jgi:hypothetical protein